MEEEIQSQNEKEEEDKEEADYSEEESTETESDINRDKEMVLLSILRDIKDNLDNAISILGGSDKKNLKVMAEKCAKGEARVVEGVFAGDKMVGSDGSIYDIPLNYASKSKLVEGDILKLTITPSGNFIYKQIGPIPRKRVMGELIVDEEREDYWVASETEKWRILKASATYFKGQTGDKTVFLIPQDAPSKWAAVENIVKNEE